MCECECGTRKPIAALNLKNGHTQSCGCLGAESSRNNLKKAWENIRYEDLTNQKFGRLTALYRVENRANQTTWHCQCDCGNTHEVSGSLLRTGKVRSCGCISSYGEECIATICRKHSLQYEQQKTFESCRFKDTGKKARFDFYINQSYLIEFDGVQHFICTDKDWNTLENFEQTQMRDAYKNQWCKDNNIPLIRIPYTKLDTLCIEDLMLETTQFRVV